jgi:hypothetical protein
MQMRKTIALFWLFAAAFFTGRSLAQGVKPAPGVTEDFVSAEPREPVPAPLAQTLARIKAPALAASIAFLASPALEGRGLGSRGLDAAAEYLAASLTLAGIPPLPGRGHGAVPEAYFQTLPIRQISGFTGELALELRHGEEVRVRSFKGGIDCLLPELPPGNLTAPVVFAAYGIREPKLGRDDYRGLDVRGRVVLILGGLPPGAEWQKPDLVARYGAEEGRERYAAKLETARAMGAVAVLGVESHDFSKRLAATDERETTFFVPFEAAAPGSGTPPLVRISSPAADFILAAADLDSGSAVTAKPAALPGAAATIRTGGSERVIAGRNVIGFIAGSDPTLREDAVVIGAHMDHLGRVGDVIYPGADDNASGTSALLEIAKAFAASTDAPRRTLVFAFWTGEEEGKFGSGWWVRHPLWPLKRTVAYLNLDMIAHPWSMEEIRKLVADTGLPDGEQFLAAIKPADFAEPGVAEWSPDLAAVLRRAGPAAGLAIHLDRTDGRNGGSDYRDFARAGVPFVRFFGNFFPAYHEPGDTPDQIDPVQVQRIARFCSAAAWILANR